jgi:hypothetical protein
LRKAEVTDEMTIRRQIVLHLRCLLHDHNLRWHCAGMLRAMFS